MNRVLFHVDELRPDGRVSFDDRRARHILRVLHAKTGQCIRMGILNGDRGIGEIVDAGTSGVTLMWIPSNDPPPSPRVDLILALPRPKVMKRLWAPLASMGVGRIVLTNAAKVDRQYFDTHWLAPEFYTPLLIEGLEQSGDTRVPEVRVCRQLKPLVEDELDALFPETLRLLAHPGGAEASATWLRPDPGQRVLLCAGPEGGWTEFELSMFERHRFRRVSLGWRTLRTDTACIALVAMAEALLTVCCANRPLSTTTAVEADRPPSCQIE